MYAFCHIPKTAGTTLNYILQSNFGPDLLSIIPRSKTDYNYNELKLDLKLYKKIKCISGHGLKPYIDYKEYSDDLKWFTFIRKPINRYVSQYIHQYTGTNELYNLPIEDWAAKFNRSNWLVKWLAGEENFEKAIQIIDDKFIFVGLVEDFDNSLKQMKSIFESKIDISYNKPRMVVRDNELKNQLLVERYKELLPLYNEQNELDIKLYNYIRDVVYKKQQDQIQKLHETSDLNAYYSSNPKMNEYMFKLKRNLIYKPFVFFTK